MPVWAQVFLATLPTATLLLAGIFWVVRQISNLQGQVAAILALLAALVGARKNSGEDKAKVAGFGDTGLPGARS